MNLCRACREDFSSLETFDAHRVGVHAYSYLEGLALDPPRDDGRRCLEAAEMLEKGWLPQTKGRWINLARAERARTAFRRAA